MPPKKQPQSINALVARISDELTAAISAEVERRVADAISAFRNEMKSAISVSTRGGAVDQRRGGRLCPVPGCGNPGAGPRNRWFCRDHASKLSVSEMKAIIDRNNNPDVEARQPSKVASDRVVRLPPKKLKAPRTLDMSCRVEGCTNRSRGPRTGFICDMHRQTLTPEEQLDAREAYKQRSLGRVIEAPRPSLPPAPVPPIVRKVEAPAESN